MTVWRWPRQVPEAVAELPAGVTAVWAADLDPPADQVARYAALLTPEEAARAARFHFARDRRRFSVARGVLRRLLGATLGVRAGSVVLQSGAQGKPALAGGALQFNVSHSGGVGLFAFCRDMAVGVDVEQVRPMPDALALAGRFFAPEERQLLQATAPDARDAVFLRIWTCKEAFIKALGEGLSHPLDAFSVGLDGAPHFTRQDHDDPDAWTLTLLEPAVGWTGALALRGSTAVVRAVVAPQTV